VGQESSLPSATKPEGLAPHSLLAVHCTIRPLAAGPWLSPHISTKCWTISAYDPIPEPAFLRTSGFFVCGRHAGEESFKTRCGSFGLLSNALTPSS